MTTPSTSTSLSLSRTGRFSKSRRMSPWGLTSSSWPTPRSPQMCFRTCSSSLPSTSRIFLPAISTHLDLVTCGHCQFVSAEQRWNDGVALSRQTNEQAIFRLLSGGFLESFDGVPTVGRGENLHVEPFGEAQDSPPHVQLDGVVH